MARFTGPKGKIVRRFGVNIYGTSKFDQLLERRGYGPGQHGPTARRKHSEYAVQLMEKQKLRHSYCLLERQFRRFFRRAQQMSGVTGDNLLQLLETRLDSLLFRAGFASTISQARQLVNHGHLQVNGRRVDIPSFQVRGGDKVSVSSREKSKNLITDQVSNNLRFNQPDWFKLDKDNLQIDILRLPHREEIPTQADEKLIIEFYSK